MKVQKLYNNQRTKKYCGKTKKYLNYRKKAEKLLTIQKPSQPLFLLYKHYSENTAEQNQKTTLILKLHFLLFLHFFSIFCFN